MIGYLQITNRCNMSCAHCGFDCNESGEDITITTFTNACEMFSRNNISFNIGGGEPTIHPQFWEIIGRALSYFSQDNGLWLTTNGSRVKDSLKLIKMAESGFIGVCFSQDKYHKEIPKEVRRVLDSIFTEDPVNGKRRYQGIVEDALINFTPFAAGRAKNLPESIPGCFCPHLFVSPNGNIKQCGCLDAPILGNVNVDKNFKIHYTPHCWKKKLRKRTKQMFFLKKMRTKCLKQFQKKYI